jgi:hypothetical protein
MTDEEYVIKNAKQQLQKMQNTLQLPQNNGDGTVIYSVDFVESTKAIEFTYAFDLGYNVIYFADSLEEFQNLAHQNWKDMISSNEVLVEFIRNGFAVKFVFLGKDKTILFTSVFDELKDLK